MEMEFSSGAVPAGALDSFTGRKRKVLLFILGMQALLFILGMLAAFCAMHMSCFIVDSGCPCSIQAMPERIDDAAAPFDSSAGVYAFALADQAALHADSSIPRSSEPAALKPRYNTRFSEDEALLPANPSLRKLWTTRDWRTKVGIFSDVFQDMMSRNLLKPCDKVLCIGAGDGHEVLALKELGLQSSIGIDLVASPPLVMKGDMHSQPFKANTFDFEFSNVFDHALFTSMFAAEVERTLKPGGFMAIHLMLKNKTRETYRHNNLQDVGVLIDLFKNFDVVHVGDIDAFGLDTEVIFRKQYHMQNVKLAHGRAVQAVKLTALDP